MEDIDVCDSPPVPRSPSSSADSPGPLLPPCRICGEKASGFHYGANTCEACKAFFRRSIKRTKDYACPRMSNCKIGPGKRSLCPHCRLRVCLSVGMSKTAIKTGRYTLEKHTENILEVQKIRELKQTVKEPMPPSPSERMGICPSPEPSSDCEKMIRALVESHDRHIVTNLTLMPDEVIAEKQRRCYEEYKLKEEMFGPLATVSREQYDEIYRSTGLDIDNRQSMLQSLIDQTEISIQRYIKFVKTIPGFSELLLEDQINLVKGARYEFCLLGNIRGQSNDLQVIVSSSGKCFHVEEFGKICDVLFIKATLKFGATLKKLNLSADELVIVKSVCVLFRDRCELKNPTKVEEIQWKLIQCLLYLLNKNHKDEKGLYARIMDRLTAIRNLTEKAHEIACIKNLLPEIHISPLLLEIFTV